MTYNETISILHIGWNGRRTINKGIDNTVIKIDGKYDFIHNDLLS